MNDPISEPAVSERDAWAQELFESQRFAASLVVERQMLVDAVASAEARAADAVRPALEAARQERDQAVAARDAALAECDRARAEALAARALLERVTRSTSWRLTAPVRLAMMALLGRERGP